MNNVFKEIEIGCEVTEKDIPIIDSIFKNFSYGDINYELMDNKLRVFLKSLDIEAFKESVSNIIKQNDISKNANPLFGNIIEEIESIKSYGLKGRKRIYVDYNKERKVKGRASKEKNRSQYYYARQNDFKTENNTISHEYLNKIICGDSKNILNNLPDNCIDIIFTSPPYNFGLEYEATDDAHHWEIYFSKLYEIFDQCVRVLKYGGRIIVNIQPLFSDYIPSHHVISHYFMNKKLIWKGEILWEKNNYNCKYTAWGSWKSPSNPYLKYTWEFLEIFCKGSLKKQGDSNNIDIVADEFKKWVVSKWSIAPARNMKEYGHPAMFPEELVTRVLKLFSFENDIVLDPFNGVGTTTHVAKLLNRKYLGIDISKEYCEKAELRLKNTLL